MPSRRRRAILLNSVLGAVLVAVAVTAVLLLTGKGGSAATAGGSVRSATAQLGDVTATVSASGQISPVRTVDASFATSGTIATVDVAVGQQVTAGQRLGTLDTSDAQDALDQAEEQLSSAKAELTAAKTAATTMTATTTAGAQGGQGGQNGGGSSGSGGGGTSVIQAQSAVTQAQAAVASAQKALDETTLTAPIAGLVTAANGTVGDRAGSSASSGGSGSNGSGAGAGGSSGSGAFVTIADTSSYVVSADVAESDVAELQTGQTATVTFPAVSGASGQGSVTAIAPVGTTSSNVVTFPVTVTLATLPDGIRLGQTAQVSVTTASASNVLEVPSAAVHSAGGTHTVTVLGANDARTVTTVEVGVVGDTTTQITSGLKQGDKVLISVDSAITGSTTSRTGTGGFGGAGGGFGGGGFGGGAGGFAGRGNG